MQTITKELTANLPKKSTDEVVTTIKKNVTKKCDGSSLESLAAQEKAMLKNQLIKKI
ncbi:MAG: hypothetical protein IKU37_03085 [Candidatus Gastranaerophilales bacterium]|nr:hypothetical protein [Candidatus Gastranaerophilales bacterium]